jgi:CRP-like cAMP-binding protein
MFEKYNKVLLNCELFRNIDRDDLASMLQCLKPRIFNYEKNRYIAMAGEKFKSVGIVLEGEAMAYKENAAGTRVMMTLLKPGDVFGEIVAFSSQSKWPVTVETQQFCNVLFISREKIVGECEKMCPWHRKLIENMLMIVSDRALMLSRKVDYLSIKSIRGKISTYLLEQYRNNKSTTFMLPMNRNEMADFLNVSRPSMSREMCRMRDEGVIDFHLASVRIKDLDILKNMVE